MWYFIRLTYPDTTKQDVSKILGPPYLVSQEYSKRNKLHYHILTKTDLEKDDLKKVFYNKFPDAPHGVSTLKVDIVGDTIEDWEKVGTYTVKDGDYIHTPEFDEYIKKFVENSFTKQTPTQHINKIINEEVAKLNPDWKALAQSVIHLRAFYELPINLKQINDAILSAMVRRDPDLAWKIVERLEIFYLHKL